MEYTTFVNQIPWLSIFMGAALMFAILGSWIWFQHKVDPERGTMDSPDAAAFLKGNCGDSMKISLRFHDDRVVDAKYWTDGCRMSSACGAAAAKLALNRTPEEIADIDYRAIEEEVGGLPEEDYHCATLAAGTLQEALRTYLVGNGGNQIQAS
jgi:nitrogen fixation protein NifU and related proteins